MMHTERLKNITKESKMKCKKCRNVIVEFGDDSVVTGHNMNVLDVNGVTENTCGVDKTVWYLDDDKVPEWIKEKVTEKEWTKGRLNCPKCGARVGSFDFTSGTKCDCAQRILPGIQIIKTKVDI